MNDKEKAQKKFAAMMNKTIAAAEVVLDRKVTKAMNAVDSKGVAYNSEEEIMDAYAYEDITDDERHKLLKALEYREDRPRLAEDYLISLCRRALSLIDDDNYAERQERKRKEIRGKVAEIKRNGGTALLCGCCDDVVGEIDLNGHKTEYPNHTECGRGRVCKDCFKNCRSQCKERDN